MDRTVIIPAPVRKMKRNNCLPAAGKPVAGFLRLLVFLLLLTAAAPCNAADPAGLQAIEDRIDAAVPDPAHTDDRYGLIVIRQALTSLKSGSGGIGACLINSRTGQVVETGRNRQFDPFFRSDLHAEMDLLNRYEARQKKLRDSGLNPRECKDLILISSVEPCPMCLTRIINSGIKTMRYVAADPTGGMVTRMNCLPTFWQEFAADRDFKKADCSSAVEQLAKDLFDYSSRSFAKNRTKPLKK